MIAPAFSFRFAEPPTRSTFSIDFVTATIRRMTLRSIGLALLIGFPMTTFQQLARHFNLSPWQQDELRLLPRMLLPNGIAITIQCTVALLGILAADEAVHRGYSPLRAYATGALAGGTVGAVAAMLLGFLFEVPVGVVVLGGNVRLQPAAAASLATLQIAFVALIYRRWATMRAAQRQRHQAELARAETRRRAFESNLQAMQARVEPEFLFSTLDRILRRFETQPARASATLDDLVDYLRAALPQLRESTSTLGKEAALSQAFVNIVSARGDSATVLTTRMEGAAAEAPFPPMVLLPLINAFVRTPNGTHPVADSIVLSAAIAKRSLHVTIDGPTGILLGDRCARLVEESTARLRALYSDAARLFVEHHWTDASRDGTRLRLELPYEAADRSHR
jgi:hypothetical protein